MPGPASPASLPRLVTISAAGPAPGSSGATWPSSAASSSTTRTFRPTSRLRKTSARSSRPSGSCAPGTP